MANWWKKVEIVTYFNFSCSKITVDFDSSHKIKRSFLPGRKAMTNLDSVCLVCVCPRKQRYHFADKGLYSQAMVFPIVMNRCNSWTIKKAEHQRTDAFKLWSWRRLLKVPWVARRSNQEILKEIKPEYSLEYWGFSDSSAGKESACNAGDHGLIPGLGRSTEERIGYPHPCSCTFLVAQLVKNPPAMHETWVLSLVESIPWRRERLPLQYSGMGNSMDCIVHGITKSWTQMSNFHIDWKDWCWS